MIPSDDIVRFARGLGVTPYVGQGEALRGYYSSGLANWLLLCGRRAGKSLLSDIVAVHEAVVPTFPGVLRPGEPRFVIIVSVRLENARQHIRNIGRLLRHNKQLAKLIVSEQADSIELANDVTILSLPASARAGRGWTASTLLFDELAHFQDTEGNASGDVIFDAFVPCLATFGDKARIVITTTPASRTGLVWDLYDRRLEDWHITHRTTREMNPKVAEATIDKARKRDPESAQVEYDAEFAERIAAFLSSEAVDRAAVRGMAEVPRSGESYVMAVDPALLGDRYALMVGHKSGGCLVIDVYTLLRPPVDPIAAELTLDRMARTFRPVTILCDNVSTVERLQRSVPGMMYRPFSRPMKLRIYSSLKAALNLGSLEIPRDPDLIEELKALQIRGGVDISAPKSGRVTHDDLADCAALIVDELTGGGMDVPEGLMGGGPGLVELSRWESSGLIGGEWRGGDWGGGRKGDLTTRSRFKDRF